MERVLKKENFGIPIKQIYNGIMLPLETPIINKKRLLFVGRLEYVKGVEILLEALNVVRKKVPGIQLVIIGDGPNRAELEKHVATYELSDSVKFKGWLNSARVHKEYIKATAIIIPSIWPENLPTVCIEALAAGRPVIGCRVGGIPEMIKHNTNGKIVNPGDYNQLAVAIVDLLNSKDLNIISTNAANSMKTFQIDLFIDQLLRLYTKICKA
jgi:glycosyltransferase involved in cell wall biosynthesis